MLVFKGASKLQPYMCLAWFSYKHEHSRVISLPTKYCLWNKIIGFLLYPIIPIIVRSSFGLWALLWVGACHLPVANGRLDARIEKVHSQVPVLHNTHLERRMIIAAFRVNDDVEESVAVNPKTGLGLSDAKLNMHWVDVVKIQQCFGREHLNKHE